MPKLIFVYAVNSGLFNMVSDYAHKVMSPSTYPCNLCAVTNTMLGKKREWSDFLRATGHDVEFLHRDEVIAVYPHVTATLPVVLRSNEDSDPDVLVSSADINACRTLQDLISLMRRRLELDDARGRLDN